MLQYGDNNIYVAYLKVRLNNIRAALIDGHNPCNWGTNSAGNLFDLKLWLNLGAFQAEFGYPVTYIYNSTTENELFTLELLLNLR